MAPPNKDHCKTQADKDWQPAYVSNEINRKGREEEEELLQEEDWPDTIRAGSDEALCQEE